MDERVETIENDDWRAGNARAALAGGRRDVRRAREVRRPRPRAGDRGGPARRAGRGHQLLGCLVAAEASGLPYVTFSPYTPPIRSAGTPPFGPGFKPLPGLLGRLRDGLLRPVVMGAAEKVMRPGIAELRAARGLAPVAERRRVLPQGAADAGDHGRAVRVPPRRLGRRHRDDRRERLGAAGRTRAAPGSTRSTGRWCWSRRRRSSRTTASWCVRRWRRWPTSRSPSSPRCRPGSPDDLVVPANARVERFLPHGAAARPGRGRRHPRRHGRDPEGARRTAYPSAWCRSVATSSRWRAASRSAAAAPGCRRGSSTPERLRDRRPRGDGVQPTAHDGWPRATARPVAWRRSGRDRGAVPAAAGARGGSADARPRGDERPRGSARRRSSVTASSQVRCAIDGRAFGRQA